MLASLENWIQQYGQNYVAHAVWEDNVRGVLEAGKIRPAEQVLREEGFVSCELGTGYGQRAVVDNRYLIEVAKKQPFNLDSPVLVQDIHYYKAKKLLSETDRKEISATFNTVISWFKKVPTKADCVEASKLSYTCQNGCVAKYNYSENPNLEKPDIRISGMPGLEVDNKRSVDIENEAYRIAKEYGVNTLQIQIVNDMFSAHPIDKQIAEILQRYKSINPEFKLERLQFEDFYKIRTAVIKLSKLNPYIDTVYNGIAWSYGRLVVLRGNPNNIISSINNRPEDLKKDSCLHLLLPFENNGDFFFLDFHREDTIVLGSRKDFETVPAEKLQGVQVFAYEDMTPEQLAFFNVPQEFYEHAKETSINAATYGEKDTKPLFFSQKRDVSDANIEIKFATTESRCHSLT